MCLIESILVTRQEERRVERKIKSLMDSDQHDMFGSEGVSTAENLTGKPQELAAQSNDNRQGRDETLYGSEADLAVGKIVSESNRAYTNYTNLLNENMKGEVIDHDRRGLARELARMVLPINYYTQWYWKIDLHNLMHFLSLRADPHAQYEIRAYAEVLCDVVEQWVPIVWEAFKDFRHTGAQISGPGLELLRKLIDDARLSDEEKLAELREESGMSAREFKELLETLRGN